MCIKEYLLLYYLKYEGCERRYRASYKTIGGMYKGILRLFGKYSHISKVYIYKRIEEVNNKMDVLPLINRLNKEVTK